MVPGRYYDVANQEFVEVVRHRNGKWTIIHDWGREPILKHSIAAAIFAGILVRRG